MSSVSALGDEEAFCGACVSAGVFFLFAATLGAALARGEARRCN